MLNWRRLKYAAFAATVASGVLFAQNGLAEGDSASAGMKDFKFPIVLCRFKQAVLKDSGGLLKVTVDHDWGPEYAFPVGNVRSIDARAENGQSLKLVSGDFSGNYEIAGSSYRLRLEGSIEQGLDLAGNHQLKLRTVLEKKLEKADAAGKLWQEVGQSSNGVIAKTQTDGTVWENVYPYTFNSAEMQRYMAGGKLKQDLVIAGIRDGLLEKGAVFKVGPACGFLDGRTAKSVASVEDRQKYHAIFDQIQDAAPAAVIAAQAEPKKAVSLKLPEPAEAGKAEVAKADAERSEQDERDKQELQQREQQQDQPQAVAQAQQQMAPELQAQLAQQNQLADQAAAAYNFQQQTLNGSAAALPESRDPASSQMSGANTVGQMAQNLQALQSPEQVQQHLSMLEQQKAALAQQQSLIDQQQQYLVQRQQDLSASADAAAQAGQDQQIQTSQAAPQAVPQAGAMNNSF